MIREMKFEIFTKLPTPSLLLTTCGTVVRQVCIGIIVKETWHLERKEDDVVGGIKKNVESSDFGLAFFGLACFVWHLRILIQY